MHYLHHDPGDSSSHRRRRHDSLTTPGAFTHRRKRWQLRVPGGFFVLHTAYGRLRSIGVGGVEMIGYDPDNKNYRVTFFDSQGNQTSHTLTPRDAKWIWQGEHARCTAVPSADNRVFTAYHERSDDGAQWVPSMTVTLTKVE
jgi:Protein of unknown function (DUF1579)